MNITSRKFYVWLISVGVVLGVYLLYSLLSDTPEIEIERGVEPSGISQDDYTRDLEGEVGMIGDVGVGSIQKAKYIHLNKGKKVEREFGFEKVLRQEGDEWEIEKPYMNLFRHNLKCYINADKGKIQIETAAGRSSPKDTTLSGNVVIHVVPKSGSNVKESFIYLDDAVFISDRSQFSTAGPVEFVSEEARMLGRGMEVVYNEEADRLEFLRIKHLESLRLKTSEAVFSSGEKAEGGSLDEVNTQAEAKQEPEPAREAKQTRSEQAGERREGEEYKCLFNKNVVIDTPEQLVFSDKLFINNIFFSRGSAEEPNEAESSSESTSSEGGEIGVIAAEGVKGGETAGWRSVEANEPSEQLAEIVITCDDGIVVEPMEFSRYTGKPDEGGVGKKEVRVKEDDMRTVLVAERIDYNASIGDTVASGRSEITFYTNDVVAGEGQERAVPVEIAANKKTIFLSDLNKVIFEGDCLCTMVRSEANIQQGYTLSAPRLTINLSEEKAQSGSARDIEHVTADGGLTRLATIKTREEEFLGGIELKCREFEYDTDGRLLTAAGPGVIKLDNSKIAEPTSKVGKFSLQRPCYAVVRDFDTLNYSLDANRLVADAEVQRILIDYFPIVGGQVGEQVKVTARHIEAELVETEGGQNRLSTLTATGGISYEEEDTQFEGSRMFYDGEKSVITADGDGFAPCLFNGALVEAIEHNVKTGKTKTRIVGPGAFKLKR